MAQATFALFVKSLEEVGEILLLPPRQSRLVSRVIGSPVFVGQVDRAPSLGEPSFEAGWFSPGNLNPSEAGEQILICVSFLRACHLPRASLPHPGNGVRVLAQVGRQNTSEGASHDAKCGGNKGQFLA